MLYILLSRIHSYALYPTQRSREIYPVIYVTIITNTFLAAIYYYTLNFYSIAFSHWYTI